MDFRIPDAPVASWAAALEPLALEAWPLEPPMPHERPHLLRGEAAPLIDGLLGRGPEGRRAAAGPLGRAPFAAMTYAHPGEDPMPKRVQLRRTRGWRMPANAVKVDRTTRWGNPFRPDACGSAATAVACHRAWILGDAARLSALGCEAPRGLESPPVEEIRRELRGKSLACWCKPGTPCHADFLVELANSS